jgi:hypothetical protein
MNGFIRGRRKNSTEPEAKIQYGFRGEGISYLLPEKSIDLWFTWTNGARIYTESIAEWDDGSVLTADEKTRVFIEVVRFVGKRDEKPNIVINADDPSRTLWEELCSTHKVLINNIEYTSGEEQYLFEREMYLEFISAGKKVNIDGIEISNEEDLDDFLQKRGKNHAA